MNAFIERCAAIAGEARIWAYNNPKLAMCIGVALVAFVLGAVLL